LQCCATNRSASSAASGALQKAFSALRQAPRSAENCTLFCVAKAAAFLVGCFRSLGGVRSEGNKMIPFAEFQKLDLRVAKVLSVENHPNADKLYVLKIDLGGTERQIVAGLRAYYTPEQLLGSTIVVVANLEPAVLRGVESQGMLLAAQDGPKVLVLRPDGEAAPGSRVS
jgi:methionine--tRNA ligase beta chain